MNNPRHAFLALLLALSPAVAIACDEPEGAGADTACSSDAWSIYLPNDEGTPAPNIKLASFQHMNPLGMAERGIAHEELMRLHAAIKPLAAGAFGNSTTAFRVQVRYTLSPDEPAVFEMKTTGGDKEQDMLATFYDSASALKDFRSTAPTIYVLFEYVISPR